MPSMHWMQMEYLSLDRNSVYGDKGRTQESSFLSLPGLYNLEISKADRRENDGRK
jgi:hypothetical protein